jgi:hypothetical protein
VNRSNILPSSPGANLQIDTRDLSVERPLEIINNHLSRLRSTAFTDIRRSKIAGRKKWWSKDVIPSHTAPPGSTCCSTVA